MAYYKLRLDVWCDWDPEHSALEGIAQNISAGNAICTRRKVIAVVDRPQDIEDEAAMSFFGGRRGRCRAQGPKLRIGSNLARARQIRQNVSTVRSLLPLPNPELSGESTGKLRPGIVETVPRRLRAHQARTAPAVPFAVSYLLLLVQGRVGCTFSDA
jgi:hypothetical protein